MSIVTLKQKPIIEFDMVVKVGEEVDSRLSVYNFDNLLVDEDSIKGYKKLRAELNKELKEYEESRKIIKKEINKPYDEFNQIYEDNIKKKYTESVSKLKEAIDYAETKQKEEKEKEVREYFYSINEYDFLRFDKLNIKVLLSTTMKSLKEEVDTFLNKVKNDLSIIETQENKVRILVKYTDCLDLTEAITTVNKEIEKENKLNNVDVEETEESKVECEQKEEKTSRMMFLNCTDKEFSKLELFMIQNGIEYEC